MTIKRTPANKSLKLSFVEALNTLSHAEILSCSPEYVFQTGSHLAEKSRVCRLTICTPALQLVFTSTKKRWETAQEDAARQALLYFKNQCADGNVREVVSRFLRFCRF